MGDLLVGQYARFDGQPQGERVKVPISTPMVGTPAFALRFGGLSPPYDCSIDFENQ
jgi:hypothetical protein